MQYVRLAADNKYLCLFFLAASFIYGLVLPFCWHNNPSTKYGTLSVLCEDHKPFFWIWAVLMSGCFLFNCERMYMKYGVQSVVLDACLALSVIGLILTAATLGHPIDSWNPKRVAHWIGTILYIAALSASIVLFFALNLAVPGFPVMFGVSVAVLIGFGVWFAVLGRSGYMEIVPLALIQIVIFVVTYTPLIKSPALP